MRFLFLFVFWVQLGFLPGVSASVHVIDCENLLYAMNLPARKIEEVGREFFSYQLERTTSPDGFVLIPLVGSRKGEEKYLFNFPAEPILNSEIWDYGGEQYQFFDVGFKRLEASSNALHMAISRHIQTYPGRIMRVLYSPEQSAYRKWITQARWDFHTEVLNRYAAKKEYLDPQDMNLLVEVNQDSSNNDVFGVVKSESGDPAVLNQVTQNLLFSVQVSYFGSRNFHDPNFGEYLKLHRFNAISEEKNLPFEYRLNPREKRDFLFHLYGEFNPFYTCELTRLAKFSNQLPRAVQNRVLLRAIRALRSRGMRFIFVVGDIYTERLFSRYGFKRYSVLPNRDASGKTKAMTEYLMTMKIEDREFRTFIGKLVRDAK